MQKAKWCDLKSGLKSLLSRNAIITVLYNIAYQYSITMKNASRPLVVSLSCELPVSYVSALGSLYSFIALIIALPIGSMIDHKREWMKRILITVNIMRAFTYVFGYGMVTSQAGITLVYIIDGMLFSFCNVMGPALMAVSVNKKALGSAFALYSGATAICISTSKSMGVSLFNNAGRLPSFAISGGIAVLSAVILTFLNGKKVCETMLKEEHDQGIAINQRLPAKQPENHPVKNRKLPFLLAGISIAALPLALSIGLAQIEDMVSNSYLAIFAMERDFDYYMVQSLLAALSGVITMFIGVICDIINPVILVYIGLLGKAAGSLLIFASVRQEVFLVGFCLITVTDFFITVVRVSATKMFSYREQGSLSATISVMMSVCMMLGTLPAGFMAQAYGTNYAYLYSGITSLLGMAAYSYAVIKMRRRAQIAS